jgi:hypothetical protein
MADSSEDAVDYINVNFNKSISLSSKYLSDVDEILLVLAHRHKESPFDNKDLFTLSTIFGAYFGEVYKSLIGGTWIMDNSNPDAPFIALNYGGRQFPFPSVCFEKMTQDKNISLLKYFELAADQD